MATAPQLTEVKVCVETYAENLEMLQKGMEDQMQLVCRGLCDCAHAHILNETVHIVLSRVGNIDNRFARMNTANLLPWFLGIKLLPFPREKLSIDYNVSSIRIKLMLMHFYV